MFLLYENVGLMGEPSVCRSLGLVSLLIWFLGRDSGIKEELRRDKV